MKKLIIAILVLTSLVLYVTLVKANEGFYKPLNLEDQQLEDTVTNKLVDLVYSLRKVNDELEVENDLLKRKNKVLQTIVDNRNNSVAVLVPDAKYVGEGKYCYPLYMGNDTYYWECDQGKQDK